MYQIAANRPIGRRGSACEGAQGHHPARETVTVLRLARHPARRQGVRCRHCRTHTHTSNLWNCLPVHQFTVPSEPLPYACCGCTCQQPHAGPGWALSAPPPAQPAQAQLGLEHLECLTLHIKSGTTNFSPVQLCNQHRRRIHMGGPWDQHRRRNITFGIPPICHGLPSFSSPAPTLGQLHLCATFVSFLAS